MAMSDEPHWLKVHQECERLYVDFCVAYAQENAQRDLVAHDQLEDELSNFLRAGTWLWEHAAWSGLTRLTAALWEDSRFLQERGLTRQAMPLLEYGLEAARALGDVSAICARLNSLGETLLLLGQVEQAISLHGESLTLAQAADDLAAMCATLCALGLAWIDRDVSKALPYLTQAQQISDGITDPTLEIELLSALATAYTQQGQSQLAASYLEQALVLAQKERDVHWQAEVLYRRGYLHHASGNLSSARIDYQRTADLLEGLADTFRRGRVLQAMGATAIELNQAEQGIAELEQALEIHRQTGDEMLMPFTLAALGEGYIALGECDTARVYLDLALEAIAQLNAHSVLAACEEQVRHSLEKIAGS